MSMMNSTLARTRIDNPTGVLCNMEEEPIIKLNLLGVLCPIPVHETRRAMDNCSPGQMLEIICDDPETLHDIPALCDRLGAEIRSVAEDSGEIRFFIKAPKDN